MITLISTSVEIVLLEMKHCNQDEEPLMSIAEIKESKFSRIAFTGEMHFDPKLPLSHELHPGLTEPGMFTVRGAGISVDGTNRDAPHPSHFPALLPSVCQGCPSCAVIWPDPLASLALPYLLLQKQKSWPVPVLENLSLLQGPSFQSLLPC